MDAYAADGAVVEEEQLCFHGRMDSAKTLTVLLSAIHNSKKDQFAICSASESGLRISVENLAKSLHAVVNIKADMFREYVFNPLDGVEEFRFKLNLRTLLDCLNIYGSAALPTTNVYLSYSPTSGVFEMFLEENSIVTECEIASIDAGDKTEDLDFPSLFRMHPHDNNKAVILSHHLREAFSELSDLPGAANVNILMSSAEPYFQLSAVGSTGSCSVSFPKGSESFISFLSTVYACYDYHLSLLQMAVRALSSATETLIRINDEGMLCLNHKIITDDMKNCYVSFIIMPDEFDDEADAADP